VDVSIVRVLVVVDRDIRQLIEHATFSIVARVGAKMERDVTTGWRQMSSRQNLRPTCNGVKSVLWVGPHSNFDFRPRSMTVTGLATCTK
jgi:hypothetical protein